MMELKNYTRHKLILLIFISNAAFLFSLNTSSYAESVLITGGSDSIINLTYTNYLDNNPVLIFSEQIQDKEVDLLNKIDNIVCCDSNWKDLALEVAGNRLQVVDKGTQLKIEKDGTYEVFIRQAEIGDQIPVIQIDEKKVAGGHRLHAASRKYVKIGNVKLEKGQHIIGIASDQESVIREIILVNKDKRQKYEKLVWQRINQPGVVVCYIFSDGGQFYVPRAADYVIKTRTFPHFVRVRIPGSVWLNLELLLEEELKNWSFNPCNITYNYFIEPGALVLLTYFDGDSSEDEFVQMRRVGINVDLEKYPWFDLTYRVENPNVQTIEVVFGVDFDRDGFIDEYIRGIYPRPALTKFGKFRYGVLDKAKYLFPDKEHYDLLELELYSHKLWGVDCKSPEKRGKYRFYIKSIEFCNYTPEDFLKVEDCVFSSNLGDEKEFKKWKVTSNSENYFCNIQGGNLVVTGKLGGEVDKAVTLSRSFKNLNLEKFPLIELEYRVDDPLFQNLEVILGLDFDKDGIADRDMCSSISLDRNFMKFNFNAFRIAKEAYPDMKEYNLVKIKLRLGVVREDFMRLPLKGEYSWYFRDVKVFSNSFVLFDDFGFDEPVFEIDGKRYWIGKKFKDKKKTREVVFSKIIYLEKGEHSLLPLIRKGNNFEVEWTIIEPAKRNLRSQKEPKIVFKKVNPTKYEVEVEEAKEPFWLVFSESFHEDWRLYLSRSSNSKSHEEIVADYPELGVREAKHDVRFTPQDVKYLFRHGDIKGHYLVNGYANGWYIEPEKLGSGENFKLVLYFWPQSLFYLGLGISGLTLIGCIGYLGWIWRKKK